MNIHFLEIMRVLCLYHNLSFVHQPKRVEVDHTASVFMFDQDGAFSGVIAWGESDQMIEGKILRLVKAGS